MEPYVNLLEREVTKLKGDKTVKVAVIAASGRAGSLIAKEAKDRGHQVTAIVRNAEKVKDKDLRLVEKDLFTLTAKDIKNYDVVINAFGTGMEQEQAVKHVLIYLIIPLFLQNYNILLKTSCLYLTTRSLIS